jgi:hypothetical protein
LAIADRRDLALDPAARDLLWRAPRRDLCQGMCPDGGGHRRLGAMLLLDDSRVELSTNFYGHTPTGVLT